MRSRQAVQQPKGRYIRAVTMQITRRSQPLACSAVCVSICVLHAIMVATMQTTVSAASGLLPPMQANLAQYARVQSSSVCGADGRDAGCIGGVACIPCAQVCYFGLQQEKGDDDKDDFGGGFNNNDWDDADNWGNDGNGDDDWRRDDDGTFPMPDTTPEGKSACRCVLCLERR